MVKEAEKRPEPMNTNEDSLDLDDSFNIGFQETGNTREFGDVDLEEIPNNFSVCTHLFSEDTYVAQICKKEK